VQSAYSSAINGMGVNVMLKCVTHLLLSRDKILKFDWYTDNFLMPLFELVEFARPFLLRPGNEASVVIL